MNIGKNIAELRKAKGVTQEALADIVGVSSQAVSKWESGGSPDIELLPVIADYFETSIDKLFNRKVNDYSDIQTEMAKSIVAIPDMDERLHKVFDYCWILELAIMGRVAEWDETTVDDVVEKHGQNNFSQMILQKGITSLGLNELLRYFLIIPEPKNGWQQQLHYKEEYLKLFETLSDEDTLKSLFYFYSRNRNSFTPKLLEKEFSICEEKAIQILEKFRALKLIETSEIELDDEIKTVFSFNPNSAFIPLLTFAEEIITRPHCFYVMCQNRGDDNPFLRKEK